METLTTGRWRRTGLWLLGLLVAATTLALGLNWLIIAPLIPGRTSPLVRRLEPLPLAQGLGISAEVDVTAEGPSEPEPPEEIAVDLSTFALTPEEADGGPEPGEPDSSKAGRSPAGGSTSLRGGYRALGPRSFVVKRSWLQAAGKSGPGASAAPHVVNGVIKGYRLRGVSGPLARLGLRSGDVVTAINGQKTNSPDNALRAYQRTYQAKVIRVALLRGGAPATFTYQMVD